MVKRVIPLLLLLVPIGASAQLLPPIGGPGLPRLGDVLGNVSRDLGDVATVPRAALALARNRLDRLAALVRANPTAVALDDKGDPARAGEVLVVDPDDGLVAAAAARGFGLIERDTIGGTDIGFARFASPAGLQLPRALKVMRRIAGKRSVSADQLHFQSGGITAAASRPTGPATASATAPQLGMIDGGVATTAGPRITRLGFARGAPGASNHGSAVASLLVGTGPVRGAAAGARLWAADVYGSDPAGGNAIAIAKALGWLSAERVPVVVISLVGPANPLLARVVQAVQARGTIIVAAVGNDGPAAPPGYPASYPGVIAVTAVDGRGRALIEAGRALHLDYAAPGADMLAANAAGAAVAVRGTSFAAPLAAARIAHFHASANPAEIPGAIAAANREAADLGKRGPDPRYGRGLLCGGCATPIR
ncbi:S8 family serine peptidase [Sphingomonas sp. 28-63-12]|uniref:S8 family serine peptidase n=1 Tax=Sphingomonas sp. 28-63-12 TaxID=1970434 RepID=UPI000BD00E91|nr:MAG: hypothetical protein B7Y47_07990 [Sphingomonas sp. 28-63-12]